MSKHMPLVSVIMATYNRAGLIMNALKAIQNQTFSHWECLIIDDGSTDNTEETVKPIVEADTRFKYFHRPAPYQKGLPGSRNFGLDHCNGNYVVFFDDDDIVHPLCFEICIKEMKNSAINFCRYEYDKEFFEQDKEIYKANTVEKYDFDLSQHYHRQHITTKNIESIVTNNKLTFGSCQVFWKRECFKKERFVEHLKTAEEWELYIRILSSGLKGVSIDKALYLVRKHSDSNTGSALQKNPASIKSERDAMILVVHHLVVNHLLSEGLKNHFVKKAVPHEKFFYLEPFFEAAELSQKEEQAFRRQYHKLKLRRKLGHWKRKIFK